MSAQAWDTEWAAEKASEAMRYLADFYPECVASGGSQKLHEGRQRRGPANSGDAA
jgi:hypothetical protein